MTPAGWAGARNGDASILKWKRSKRRRRRRRRRQWGGGRQMLRPPNSLRPITRKRRLSCSPITQEIDSQDWLFLSLVTRQASFGRSLIILEQTRLRAWGLYGAQVSYETTAERWNPVKSTDNCSALSPSYQRCSFDGKSIQYRDLRLVMVKCCTCSM